MNRFILYLIPFLCLLQGCGNEGAPNEQYSDTSSAIQAAAYAGPAANSPDVTRFQNFFWANVVGDDRCGACHGVDGQSPQFAHQEDINVAYAAVQDYVNLSAPSESPIVLKVGEGHNCWLESLDACSDTLERYIQNWSGQSVSASAQTVELKAPVIKDAGSSKNFPDSSGSFQTTVYPLLTAYCADCHSDTASLAQAPFFASADVDTAYLAAQNKIDLTTPAQSRFVLRLGSEFHNCWGECAANANEMLTAITQFSDTIPVTEVDPSLVLSKALRLTDGLVASSGGRFESNVVALWEFKTGSGTVAYDTSGIEPATNLNLSGDVDWVGGWGIQIIDGKAQATTTTSKKIHDALTATGEYSIEAWVIPANVTQEGPANIIGYSAGVSARNFTLGQTLYNYDFLQRASTLNANGEPALSTLDDDERLQATLQHVVATFDGTNGRRLYVNGEFTEDVDEITPGTLSDWDDTFAIVMGNEVSNNRLWQGIIRLAAIHSRALTAEQISQNFEAGVGQKFYLLFSVSHLIDVAEAYVVFEVSQFDSYAYLFNAPFFATLNTDQSFSGVPISGLRIGINGRVPSIGQAYQNLAVNLSSTDSTNGQQAMSRLGTIIGLERGISEVEFFLSFETIGDFSNVIVEATPSPIPESTTTVQVPTLGLKTFDEINASMSTITGVPQTQATVAQTYGLIKQQLPTVENLSTFVSAHQMAITQLAIAYCHELTESTTLRAAFFPSFNFDATPSVAFDTAGKNNFINALLTQVMNTGLSSQPADSSVSTELNSLIDDLSVCSGGCDTDRTKTIAKAACASTIGSAVLLIQ